MVNAALEKMILRLSQTKLPKLIEKKRNYYVGVELITGVKAEEILCNGKVEPVLLSKL